MYNMASKLESYTILFLKKERERAYQLSAVAKKKETPWSIPLRRRQKKWSRTLPDLNDCFVRQSYNSGKKKEGRLESQVGAWTNWGQLQPDAQEIVKREEFWDEKKREKGQLSATCQNAPLVARSDQYILPFERLHFSYPPLCDGRGFSLCIYTSRRGKNRFSSTASWKRAVFFSWYILYFYFILWLTLVALPIQKGAARRMSLFLMSSLETRGKEAASFLCDIQLTSSYSTMEEAKKKKQWPTFSLMFRHH